MKLISLSDYVLEKNEFRLFKYSGSRIREYAKFLKQQITLSMFMPCDENANILEEPERIHFNTDFDYKAELSVYNEARNKVLFEGFEDVEIGDNMFYITYKDSDGEESMWIDKNECIENLLDFDFEFELTHNAIKQLGFYI